MFSRITLVLVTACLVICFSATPILAQQITGSVTAATVQKQVPGSPQMVYWYDLAGTYTVSQNMTNIRIRISSISYPAGNPPAVPNYGTGFIIVIGPANTSHPDTPVPAGSIGSWSYMLQMPSSSPIGQQKSGGTIVYKYKVELLDNNQIDALDTNYCEVAP